MCAPKKVNAMRCHCLYLIITIICYLVVLKELNKKKETNLSFCDVLGKSIVTLFNKSYLQTIVNYPRLLDLGHGSVQKLFIVDLKLEIV